MFWILPTEVGHEYALSSPFLYKFLGLYVKAKKGQDSIMESCPYAYGIKKAEELTSALIPVLLSFIHDRSICDTLHLIVFLHSS